METRELIAYALIAAMASAFFVLWFVATRKRRMDHRARYRSMKRRQTSRAEERRIEKIAG